MIQKLFDRIEDLSDFWKTVLFICAIVGAVTLFSYLSSAGSEGWEEQRYILLYFDRRSPECYKLVADVHGFDELEVTEINPERTESDWKTNFYVSKIYTPSGEALNVEQPDPLELNTLGCAYVGEDDVEVYIEILDQIVE